MNRLHSVKQSPRACDRVRVTTSQEPDNRPTPPQPYNQPQQNWTAQQPPPPPKNGLGTTALVLGILGALFSLIPFVGILAWPLVILGLIFGVIGFFRSRSGKATNGGVAIAGTILSLIGLIICVIYASAFTSAVATLPAPPASAPAAPGAIAPGTADATGNPGDTLTSGDLQLTAGPLTDKTQQFIGPLKCAEVSYRNTGSTQAPYNLFDWKMQNPQGAITGASIGGDNTLSSGQLAPGGTTSGQVCFDAKGNQDGAYILTYNGTLFGNTVAWNN